VNSIHASFCALDQHLKAGYFDYVIYKLISRFSNQGLSIDVGAHYGGHTISMINAGSSVIAFDANPDCINFLSQIPNLTVEEFALSNYSSNSKKFTIGSQPGYASLSFTPRDGINADKLIDVKVRRLDDFNLSPRLIKVDVDNEEINFLIGAARTIYKHLPMIILEVSWDFLGWKKYLLKIFPLLGYSCFNLFGEKLVINDRDAWNIILVPKAFDANEVLYVIESAACDFYDKKSEWNLGWYLEDQMTKKGISF
jgi:FkbM family methyltransferase